VPWRKHFREFPVGGDHGKIKTFEGEVILPGTVDIWLALVYKFRIGKT